MNFAATIVIVANLAKPYLAGIGCGIERWVGDFSIGVEEAAKIRVTARQI